MKQVLCLAYDIKTKSSIFFLKFYEEISKIY